ncbi:MAG: response regulator [Geitlerinemataceae cyanobacterium]
MQQANLFAQVQQKLADQKLKQAAIEQQLAAIEASMDGIAILDDGSFHYVNPACVELFGYPSAEAMLGQPLASLYSPEEAARFDREIFPALAADGQWQGEAIARRIDGHHFYEELSLTRTDGDRSICVCVCRDISDRKRNEQELQRANLELARATRLKDEFLANMSHELRTPLNAILGMAEGLQDGILGAITDEQLKALQVIERGGTHLLELINDILDLAKIESGRVELHIESAQLGSLCKSSLSFVKQQAQKKSIALHVRTPDRDPTVRLDKRRIRQVLINLLNNAVKFTPDGGQIELHVAIVSGSEAEFAASDCASGEVSQWLRLSVTDTGIGIASEDLDRLFQPFSQVDSALNRQYNGTGLGLALVKHIAQLHGGTVGVRSEVEVGSEFWAVVPFLPVEHEPGLSAVASAAPADGSSTSNGGSAPLVLLAEDNEANTLTMSNYLQAKGYRVAIAKNGLEAIATTQSQLVDLILMDVQMPTMNGLEAIGQIRQDPIYAETPIVAVTALTMGGDRERCLAAGADEYLSKPVALEQLVRTIRALLDGTEEKP